MILFKYMAEHNKIGRLGENIACKYLETQEFRIIERNFRVRTGEIDIIVSHENSKEDMKDKSENSYNFDMKPSDLIFVEVKTKKVNSFKDIKQDSFSPENNLSFIKRQRLLRAVKHYLSFRNIDETKVEISFMALIVFINPILKQAKIRKYENFVL